MKQLFSPSSIAVFGVSEQSDNFGRNIVKNLLDFQFEGKIFPVGRSGGKVYGMDIYTCIEDVPEIPGLVIFLIPARFILEEFNACARKGVKRMIISSGGFSEMDDERCEIENSLLKTAEEYGIRFLGPNCIAAINQDVGLCLPFVRMKRFLDGPVTCLTQSGGVGLSLIYLMTGQNLGINKYVSLGNKLNISESDLIPFLEDDESTKVICFYLEEIAKGRAFMNAMRGCTKPVVVLKSNVSPETARVAKSHTAAIANDDRIIEAAFRQTGVTRVSEIEQYPAVCKVFSMPEMKGNKIAVITPTGGFAVMIADLCSKYGFELPEFPQPFIKEVSSHVKAGVISLSNPLDLGDMFDFQMVAHTVTEAMKQVEFDALVLSWILLRDIGVGVDIVNVFPLVERMMKKFNKPVILSFVGDPNDLAYIRKTTKFPVFSSPEESMMALAALRDFHLKAIEIRTQKPVFKDIDKDAISKIIAAARSAGRTEIGMEALSILKACGISVADSALAGDAISAAAAALDLGFPVAMKIVSPDILHKTEFNGVRLNISNGEECEEVFEALISETRDISPDCRIDGVLVQKMCAGGRELMAGIKLNESFGHVVVFGLGGTLVEAIDDISLRIAPLGEIDVSLMVSEIRAKKILGAFRGLPPADVEAIKDVLLRLSTLTTLFPEIIELDVNPLFALPEGEGCLAVDARIVLSNEE